jgi:hypothetical protein
MHSSPAHGSTKPTLLVRRTHAPLRPRALPLPVEIIPDISEGGNEGPRSRPTRLASLRPTTSQQPDRVLLSTHDAPPSHVPRHVPSELTVPSVTNADEPITVATPTAPQFTRTIKGRRSSIDGSVDVQALAAAAESSSTPATQAVSSRPIGKPAVSFELGGRAFTSNPSSAMPAPMRRATMDNSQPVAALARHSGRDNQWVSSRTTFDSNQAELPRPAIGLFPRCFCFSPSLDYAVI